jgi:nucleoid DNA-binding protein
MATKNHLASAVSNKIKNLSLEDSIEAIDMVLDYLKSELSLGNRIEIRGFGSFSIRGRKFAGKDGSYNTIYYRMGKPYETKATKT